VHQIVPAIWSHLQPIHVDYLVTSGRHGCCWLYKLVGLLQDKQHNTLSTMRSAAAAYLLQIAERDQPLLPTCIASHKLCRQ
jgi:hypothetical protein